jgi:phosphopentomutase
MRRRVVLLVADSLGVGAMPDAAEWGDTGANTLAHVLARARVALPNLQSFGLGNVCDGPGLAPVARPLATWGRMATAGAGKDTIAGHWELAGVRVQEPFATYMDGFPLALMDAFCAATGVGWLGNLAASGTEIIEQLGQEHVASFGGGATGKVIVYTSSDSVLQVAAHEDVVPLSRLHAICAAAFPVARAFGIARVIARPFVGVPGAYVRTEGRKDIALPPPRPTLVDRCAEAGVPTVSIGKVASIFGDRGFSRQVKAGNNGTIFQALLDVLDEGTPGLVFPNLVDFDMLYGHRRDPLGYARALAAMDARWPELLARLGPDDLLLVVADHGNDPTAPGSDHTREYVPILAYRAGVEGAPAGTRATLADAGATAAAWLGVRIDEGTPIAQVLA